MTPKKKETKNSGMCFSFGDEKIKNWRYASPRKRRGKTKNENIEYVFVKH